jgi:predicted SAM-dependent methyltransferase
MSETQKCRARLIQFCKGNGIDVGYGGDPICPSAITCDLPHPYTKVGQTPQNLSGDARNLYWFSDNVLDYVYSSHLLEDFEDTCNVLKEWLRVIKPGGHLILYCPDEKIYSEHCKKTGQDIKINYSHKIKEFSLEYVKNILKNFEHIEIVHEKPLVDIYSFELVVRKKDVREKNGYEGKYSPLSFDSSKVVSKTSAGFVDIVEPERVSKDALIHMGGWAYDPQKKVHAEGVVIVCDGKQLLISPNMGLQREDVAKALKNEKLTTTGWDVGFKASIIGKGTHRLEAYALVSDGTFIPLKYKGKTACDVEVVD